MSFVRKYSVVMNKQFKRINRWVAAVVFAISAVTYLATIEPTASFWDCGEFIASSYKLEVGHPPGNPVFQIIARVFTLFGDSSKAAMLVNAMSALCSAFTILLLYLSIVHLCRRAYAKKDEAQWELMDIVKVCAAGVVGALAYCWSDTFWFSAVEGEVYAMSSLATALVFWAMLRWEEDFGKPYANRWIILIMFIMGLSIGVHLLNLLAIPALGLIYYYKTHEGKTTTKGAIYSFLISCVILGVVLWGVIPLLPRLAGAFDLVFVNAFHLPVNSGAATFVILLIVACFAGVYATYKKGKVLANTILLSLGCIIIGYTLFVPVVERSSVNTPTNEYQPDNPFTLIRYLGREQYGSAPLIYGQTFNSSIAEIKNGYYYNIMEQEDGSLKYEKLNKPAEPVYESSEKVFFPRMYTGGGSGEYIPFYNAYTKGDASDNTYIPTLGDNLRYFFGYQVNFMYWRYFMWNFVGRQNDLHSSSPGDIYKGNWESGIGFIDKLHLGDMSEGPDYIVNSRAKNHFYFLPLILGILGIIFQWKKDKKNFTVLLLLFFMTGIAIVLYLNQPPFQPRERDYAYAGSFYVFAFWIGFAVLWLAEILDKLLKNRKMATVVASIVCILGPVQMVSQTWDDHTRSNRYTCRDMAYNILSGLDENAMLVTHGDNDTFPLWYLQEVEGVRTDVRVVNTSLLGIDWYIDQMKWKQYESDPLPITLSKRDYYYGNNDYVVVTNTFKEPTLAKKVMYYFVNPKTRVKLGDNLYHGRILAKNITIPVNKENVMKYGIVAEKDFDKILDTVTLRLPENSQSMGKTDLILLDLLSNYNWDRPLYFLQRGGDVNIGIKSYLQYEGFAYKFVPIQSTTATSQTNDVLQWQMDAQKSYDYLMDGTHLESLSYDYNVDYQNLLTFTALVPIREIMCNVAIKLLQEGDTTKALNLMEKMEKVMPEKNFPLNTSLISSTNDLAVIDAIGIYFSCGKKEEALALGERFTNECIEHVKLALKNSNGYDLARKNLYYLLYLVDTYQDGGAVSEAAALKSLVDTYINLYQGGA